MGSAFPKTVTGLFEVQRIALKTNRCFFSVFIKHQEKNDLLKVENYDIPKVFLMAVKK